MRCEANISLQEEGRWLYEDQQIKPRDGYELNAKVEVKNINSFKAVEKAINFEINRQTEMLEKGESIIAETRGWNDSKNATKSQRVKETAADYRYFPEPDIPPLNISDDMIADIAQEIGELPDEKTARFIEQYGLRDDLAAVITDDKSLADWTEQVISELGACIKTQGDSYDRQDKKLAATAANWITSELLKYLRADHQNINQIKITPKTFAELVCLIYQGKITSTAGQIIMEKMYRDGGKPEEILNQLGLGQIDDKEQLAGVIREIIKKNPSQATEYRGGKTPLLQFFIGKTMAETKGKANPAVVRELLEKLLQE
jgi:aspartyl-tRNA(Asn)/glutamyl-tRNA(Gln) amidotransferase subunit B